jgi:hypothetical protein
MTEAASDPELEQLLADADEADRLMRPPVAGTPEAAPPPPPPDPARELEPVLMVLRTVVLKLKPTLAPVWTEGAMTEISRAVPPVLDKYGLTLGGLLERWGPELALAVAAAPVAWGTFEVLTAEPPALEAKPADGDAPSPAS